MRLMAKSVATLVLFLNLLLSTSAAETPADFETAVMQAIVE